MAIFRAINDKALKDLDAHEMAEFFTDHIFFKFMDDGRKGLQAGVKDMCDTSIERVIQARGKLGSKAKTLLDGSDEYRTFVEFHVKKVLSAFITGGTKEMNVACFMTVTDPLLYN